MAEVTRSAPVSALAVEFDDFLFAPIGEERNGMLLSVVSVLARLDIDPWQEAANLAELPKTTATRRLASLIASLPERPSTNLDPGTVAARLIARLPRRIGVNVRSAETSPDIRIRAVIQSQALRYAALILMVFVLTGLGIAASQQTAARAHNADSPASGRVIPATPPPIAGQ
jgi:hypothetical protein